MPHICRTDPAMPTQTHKYSFHPDNNSLVFTTHNQPIHRSNTRTTATSRPQLTRRSTRPPRHPTHSTTCPKVQWTVPPSTVTAKHPLPPPPDPRPRSGWGTLPRHTHLPMARAAIDLSKTWKTCIDMSQMTPPGTQGPAGLLHRPVMDSS